MYQNTDQYAGVLDEVGMVKIAALLHTIKMRTDFISRHTNGQGSHSQASTPGRNYGNNAGQMLNLNKKSEEIIRDMIMDYHTLEINMDIYIP